MWADRFLLEVILVLYWWHCCLLANSELLLQTFCAGLLSLKEILNFYHCSRPTEHQSSTHVELCLQEARLAFRPGLYSLTVPKGQSHRDLHWG